MLIVLSNCPHFGKVSGSDGQKVFSTIFLKLGEFPSRKDEKEKKPPKVKPAAESAAAAAAAEKAPSESDDDPNDIDPTSAEQYDGIVTLLKAREILGHRAFDPFYKKLLQRR